ncbi:hypothetical protein JCM9140_1377 [Halalkalibacter wakoensis JCM 9140]|uniref:Uncharacterized protein n=1 Tax=Halalkalibacter wakoensis JCM 9140 TaxID=1236970 RepID=W4PZX3_9BACI|nr:hypothetical protein [Halalkalibacter wakoensis]GAE25386.1 hypothetical protein JCM9140_1377 [Halalkalibacter wakoensis JCM 9140]
MNVIFDVSWHLFHWFLIAMALIGVAVLLSFFMKNKILIFVTLLILVTATIFAIDQTRYSTFEELFEDQLHDDSTVKAMSIAINDISGQIPNTEVRATIEDESIIHAILEDFSELELKKDEDALYSDNRYTIAITINNEVREGVSRISDLYIDVDYHSLNGYEIISNTNHLQTIESLIEHEKVEWVPVND